MDVLRRPRPAEAVAVPEFQPRAWRYAVLTVAGLAVGGLALRLIYATGLPQIRTFLLISGSLLVEALPFILLGAAVSALIEVFVPGRIFARLGRLPGRVQMPLAGMGGFAFPVCECGSIPVARRLAAKGLSPSAAITFMLAAPVLNPVVLVATAVAYAGRGLMWPMVAGRAVLSLVVAMTVGWVLAVWGKKEMLRPIGNQREHGQEESVPEEHDQGSGRAQAVHHRGRVNAFFTHLSEDFLFMAKYLVIGAVAAGILQTFVPSSFIDSVADTPVLSALALMALAGALSLCSQSDAFVAVSFVQFGAGAQLAFLVFGPMVDAKLLFLYAGTFSRGFIKVVVVTVAAVTLAGALWMEVLVG